MLSVKEILECKTPTISRSSVIAGRPIVIDLIDLIITDFLEFIGQTLSITQRQMISEKILDEYPNYLPETIRLCFSRISSGRYGVIYGQVNGMVIMEFFKKFDAELDEEVIDVRAKESDNHKKGIISILNIETDDEKKVEAFRKMKEDLMQIGKEKEVKKTVSHKINDTQINQLNNENKKTSGSIIQQWIREFDDLYKSTGIQSQAVKRVTYNGDNLGLLEFLDIKQKEFNEI